MDSLLTLSKDADFEIRRAAISALGKTGDKRVVPTLIAALEDRDIRVAEEAWSALAELKDPKAIPALIESLKLEPGPEQGGVFSAYPLSRFGSPVVQPLIDLLNDSNARTRLRAASTLSMIGDARVAPALLTALNEKNYAAIAGGYEYYIDSGVAASEDALIKAIEQYGDDEMARTFISCGNARLEVAGRAWEQRRFGKWGEGKMNPFWGARAMASSKAATQ